MPSGEVFTGPHETSAEGHIRFTIPTSPRGVVVEDVTLEFREGRVVSARAERGDGYLQATLETDDGARYPRRARDRHELRHRPPDRRDPVRREDRRHRPPRARQLLSRDRRHQRVRRALGPDLRPARGRHGLTADGDTILDGRAVPHLRLCTPSARGVGASTCAARWSCARLRGAAPSAPRLRQVDALPALRADDDRADAVAVRARAAAGRARCSSPAACSGATSTSTTTRRCCSTTARRARTGRSRSSTSPTSAFDRARPARRARSDLAGAARLPFDGMNERGVAVAMAAVPEARSPAGDAIGSLGVIRLVLDRAASVDEASRSSAAPPSTSPAARRCTTWSPTRPARAR